MTKLTKKDYKKSEKWVFSFLKSEKPKKQLQFLNAYFAQNARISLKWPIQAKIWTKIKQGFSVLVYILEHDIPIGTARTKCTLKYWFK